MKSITNYDEHFYYNKEYWRERVRMFCSKGPSYAREVTLVEMFVRDNPATKDYYTEELHIWFQDFISKCYQGYFENMTDISYYKWNGLDVDRLNLWLSLQGLNRCENYH